MRTIALAAFLSISLAALPNLSAQQFSAQPSTILEKPRKAPEFTIVEPTGKKMLLSSYRGKVVVLAFISTECPHCQKECEMLSQLYTEMKPKGVQILASAFNDGAAVRVPGFIQAHHVNFPVGYTDPESVLSFQSFSVMDRPSVPQVAVIDKKGMIRAQTPPPGDVNLQDEGYLRDLLTKLAGEGISATPIHKASVKTGSR